MNDDSSDLGPGKARTQKEQEHVRGAPLAVCGAVQVVVPTNITTWCGVGLASSNPKLRPAQRLCVL